MYVLGTIMKKGKGLEMFMPHEQNLSSHTEVQKVEKENG